MFVRRPHEGHDAIAWWTIDCDPCLHQAIAGGVNIIDFECQVAKMARLAIVLCVPVVSKFHLRPRAARFLTVFKTFLVIRTSKENQSIPVFLIYAASGFFQAKLVTI